MRLGEALSRCPELALVPPDTERAERAWESVLRRLEGIGAEVESERAGEAFFEVAGLRRLWGGTEGVLARAREEAGMPLLLAAAPVRFCAYAAAATRPRVVADSAQVPLPPTGVAAERAPGGGGRPAQRAGAARHRHPRPARRACPATRSPIASARSGCGR